MTSDDFPLLLKLRDIDPDEVITGLKQRGRLPAAFIDELPMLEEVLVEYLKSDICLRARLNGYLNAQAFKPKGLVPLIRRIVAAAYAEAR